MLGCDTNFAFGSTMGKVLDCFNCSHCELAFRLALTISAGACATSASTSIWLAATCGIIPQPTKATLLFLIVTVIHQQNPYWASIFVVFQVNFLFKGITYDITALVN